MPYWDTIGRSLVLEGTKERCDQIAEYLTFNGIDATVASSITEEEFVVTVPKELGDKAYALYEKYMDAENHEDDTYSSYRENCLKHSPNFVPSEEKFRTSTNSSVAFLCAGFIVILMAIIHFILVITQTMTDSTIRECIIELILGFIFMMFGISTQQKVRMLETKMQEENSFTNQIVDWCVQIYPAEHLDKCIDAASDEHEIAEEERFFLRRQLIQNYILREYDIQDSAYLDYITDLIYKKLYHPNAVSAS